MLAFPSLSIISPSIWVLSALGIGEMMLSAMLCSLEESLGKRWVDRVTEERGASLVHGFHWNPALCTARVTSFIISCASVGFLEMINMLSAHVKWLISFPFSLNPVPCACHLLVSGCMMYLITLLNSAGARVPRLRVRS